MADKPEAYTRKSRIPIYFPEYIDKPGSGVEGRYNPPPVVQGLGDLFSKPTPNIELVQSYRDKMNEPGGFKKFTDTLGHELVHSIKPESWIDKDTVDDSPYWGREWNDPKVGSAQMDMEGIPATERLAASLFGGYAETKAGRPDYQQDLMRRAAAAMLGRNPNAKNKAIIDLVQHHYNLQTGAYKGPNF